MASLLITRLDYLRLKERVQRIKILNVENLAQADALLQSVHRATLVDSINIPSDVITMNSLVRIIYRTSGRIEELRLVYPEQADSKQNRISVLSAIGMALLGSKEGDSIQVKLPKQKIDIQVKKILYQPEAAGNYYL